MPQSVIAFSRLTCQFRHLLVTGSLTAAPTSSSLRRPLRHSIRFHPHPLLATVKPITQEALLNPDTRTRSRTFFSAKQPLFRATHRASGSARNPSRWHVNTTHFLPSTKPADSLLTVHVFQADSLTEEQVSEFREAFSLFVSTACLVFED